MFLNFSKIATINMSIPTVIVSVERSFSQRKLINSFGSCLSDTSSSHWMKIAIESPNTLTDGDPEEDIAAWNKKGRRLAVFCKLT